MAEKNMVSVIIRTIAREEGLRRAIASVAKQSYVNIELVIVNDSDSEIEWVCDLQSGSIGSLVLVNNFENHGRCRAANVGLESASGKYLLFLDDDDWIDRGHIEKLLIALELHTDAVLSYTQTLVVDENGEELGRFDFELDKMQIFAGNYMPIHSILFRSSVLAQGCRFDESLDIYEDWDFWIQLSRHGDFVYTAGISAYYVLCEGQNSDAYVPQKAQEATEQILKKWLMAYKEEEILLLMHETVKARNIPRLHNKINALYEDINALYEDINALHEDRAKLQFDNNKLNSNIDELINSKSWKITQPLRDIAHTSRSFMEKINNMKLQKYFLLVVSNPQLLLLFVKDMFRHGIKSSIRKAKRKINEKRVDAYKNLVNISDVLEKFSTQKSCESIEYEEVVDILIPIYNGFEFLEPLFKSIVKNSSLKYRLIIINDCSPDVRVADFLQKFIELHRDLVEIVFIENKKNLGFLKSVNRAVREVQNHFILLNSDTEVPPMWLERLMSPIINNENIATTTPMTNSGEICSFPKWLSDNKIYRGLDVTSVDKYFSYVCFEKNSVSVPTGVGFCMGVNKNVYDKIGMFDEVFGKGYGEENDWCMRAIESGYKNIIVPNLFVYHKHGGSFLSSEKKAFIENNLKILWKKHPSYNGLIQELIEKNPLKEMRAFLEVLITFDVSKKNILIIDHELGGGTSIYRDERITQYLKNEEHVILFSYNFLLNSFKISFYLSCEEVFSYACSGFGDIEKINNFIRVDEIFLNSVVSFTGVYESLTILRELVKKSGASLVLPMHDFNSVCPSYTLLNHANVYCDVPQDLSVCNRCLKKHSGSFRTFNDSAIDILEWRKEWRCMIELADKILCFSDSSADIIQRVYSGIEKKIEIIPHKVEILSSVYDVVARGEDINIAVIGGINLAKGALILKEMVELIEKNKLNINIIVVGELDLVLKSKHLKVHGRYERDTLPELMKQYNIMACMIPSIWPETFSYTTEEVMMMGLPLFVFDLGALAERVKKYSKGYIIDTLDASSALDTIKKVFEK